MMLSTRDQLSSSYLSRNRLSSMSGNQPMEKKIRPIRFALRYKPPTLVIFYVDHGTGKTRRRSIPLRGISRSSSGEEYTEKLLLIPRHQPYTDSIVKMQLVSLIKRVWQISQTKKRQLSTHPQEPLNVTKDETLPLLQPSVKASKSSTNSALDKELEQLLSGNDKADDDSSSDEEKLKQPAELSTALNKGPLMQSPISNLSGLSMKRSLPPISSSSPKGSLSSLGSLPPLTSSPLTGSGHRSTSLTLTPIETSQLKPPALQPLNKVTREMEKNTPDNFSSHSPPTPPTPPPPPHVDEDISLKEEILSELSEELTDTISSMNNDEPLMLSEGLKTLENIKLVSDEDDENEGEDFNKMSETDYEQRKKLMEEQFESQKLKPGDDGFVYDKQVEFPEPRIESGWDSDQDDSDLEF